MANKSSDWYRNQADTRTPKNKKRKVDADWYRNQADTRAANKTPEKKRRMALPSESVRVGPDDCKKCKGTGKLRHDVKCPRCAGTGSAKHIKESVEQIEEGIKAAVQGRGYHGEMSKQNKDADKEFAAKHAEIMKNAWYKKGIQTFKRSTYGKNYKTTDPSTIVNHFLSSAFGRNMADWNGGDINDKRTKNAFNDFMKSYSPTFFKIHEEKETPMTLDELKKSTYAKYLSKAGRSARASTSLAKDFEDDEYRAMATVNKHSSRNMDTPRSEKDPDKLRKANRRMKGAASLKKQYKRDADNRVKGIARAGRLLAKEDVEQIDELTDKQKAEIAKRKEARLAKKSKAKEKSAAKKAEKEKTKGSRGGEGSYDKEDDHVIMQFRKAQDVDGNMDIKFGRGKTGKVAKADIDAVLGFHDKLTKPDDKRRMRIKLAKGGPAAAKQLADIYRKTTGK